MKKRTISLQIAVLATLLILTACKKNEDQTSKDNLPPPVTKMVHVSTPAEWKTALLTSYKEGKVTDKGDGVSLFPACFSTDEQGKCIVSAAAERDVFRKIHFYKPGYLSVIGDFVCPYVKSYVSLRDNALPSIFLNPCFFGKNGWLFMDKLAIMVDGNVLLEREFDKSSINREVDDGNVVEHYHFIATQEDIQALRKISPTSEVIIRLSGDKGYVNVSKKFTKIFKDDMVELMMIYDAINNSVRDHIPPPIK